MHAPFLRKGTGWQNLYRTGCWRPPSAHARARYLYVQEIGTLTSMEPHISSRENLSSYLFLTVRRGEGYLTYRGKRHFIKTGDCVYINCRNQYAHESTAEHPWTLMWVAFQRKRGGRFLSDLPGAGARLHFPSAGSGSLYGQFDRSVQSDA